MKIILIFSIIFFTGCSKSHNLNISSIQTINYNGINLIESDFSEILNKINKLKFKKKELEIDLEKELRVVSNEKIYNFKISGDNLIYKENDNMYIANNITDLKNLLNKFELEYTDFSFFKVTYNKCETNNDFVIKIDNTNNCLIIDTSKILYNFKINSVTSIENNLIENNLLYQKEEIKNSYIIIKINILNTPKFKINFTTKYNYSISMFPIYDENNDIELNIYKEEQSQKQVFD